MNWYVAIVRNHWERRTAERISLLGIQTYVPVQRVFKIYCDRRKWVDVLAIPGMLFIGLPEEESLSKIYSLKLPMRLMRTTDGSSLAVVPDEEICRMREFLLRAKEEVAVVEDRFPKGSTAYVFRGPFKGMEVLVASDDNEGKARIGVELTILKRTITTLVDRSDLLNEAEWAQVAGKIES